MLSIVTGTLDRKHLLPAILENTVFASDRIELVLVDGGSTDGTQEYIKSLSNPQIVFIEVGHRSNYGHYMNLGIKASKYEWVCQWNDDVVLENKWQGVFDVLKSDDDLYVFNWYNEAVGRNTSGMMWYSFPEGEYAHCLNFGIYKKQVFHDIGLYDEMRYKYYAADSDMAERSVYFKKKIRLCHEIMVKEFDVPKKAFGEIHNAGLLTPIIRDYYMKGKIPEWVTFLK